MTDYRRRQRAILNWGQSFVLVESPGIYLHLVSDVVLLQDLHLGELMLVDQSLFQHGTADKRKHTILTAFKDFWIVPVLLLHVILIRLIRIDCAKCYGTWVLCILAFVLMDLEGALVFSRAAEIVLVIDHTNAARSYHTTSWVSQESIRLLVSIQKIYLPPSCKELSYFYTPCLRSISACESIGETAMSLFWLVLIESSYLM